METGKKKQTYDNQPNCSDLYMLSCGAAILISVVACILSSVAVQWLQGGGQ